MATRSENSSCVRVFSFNYQVIVPSAQLTQQQQQKKYFQSLSLWKCEEGEIERWIEKSGKINLKKRKKKKLFLLVLKRLEWFEVGNDSIIKKLKYFRKKLSNFLTVFCPSVLTLVIDFDTWIFHLTLGILILHLTLTSDSAFGTYFKA